MNHPFRGAGVALVTPFTKENHIDFGGLTRLIEQQIQGDIDYLVALGTTAETPTLSTNEKQELVEFIKENKKGLPLVVGAGGNDLRRILKQIDHLNFNGIDGLLVVTPYYNKPTQEGMFLHFSEIAKASPVPLILYNVPSRTGVNLEAQTVIKLAEKNENIIAVKEASGILSQITMIGKYVPDHFAVISGDDVLALPIIAVGGIGVISVVANALPQKLSRLIHTALDGNYPEARSLHFEMIDLIKLIFKEGNPGGIKALMNIQGIIENRLRTPLCPITDQTYREIESAFHRLL